MWSHAPIHNATDGKIHLCQLISGVGIFLSIDRDVFLIAVVCFDKFHALHEHAAGTATRVINLAPVRLYHFRYQIDYRLGRVILPFTFAFCYGKLAQEILIDASYQVVFLVFLRIYLTDDIQQTCQFCTVKPQSRIIIARQSLFQCRVVFLHLSQSRIYLDSDVVLFGIFYQIVPAAYFV